MIFGHNGHVSEEQLAELEEKVACKLQNLHCEARTIKPCCINLKIFIKSLDEELQLIVLDPFF